MMPSGVGQRGASREGTTISESSSSSSDSEEPSGHGNSPRDINGPRYGRSYTQILLKRLRDVKQRAKSQM
jgi:hypothetical protein